MSKSGKDENFIVYGCVVVGGEILSKDTFDGYFLPGGTMCTSAYGGIGTGFEL
jgi:hypothetical protein